jgi:protein MPE1
VTFDGTHISVFDLKREIILANRMGNGKDFDIGLFDNVTGEGGSTCISCSVNRS